MRKKVDDRIRTLIENGVKMMHRSMFVIIGDKSFDQVVNLHYMLSKVVTKARPTVLWCYKEKLGLSSHKNKRAKQVKKLMQRGVLDPEKVDPFLLFVESGIVSYCLYRDSDQILGNSYGMCILQDFEGLTPNIIARTVETVEGGGLVVLLLRTLSSLTSLCTMVMDVHERFRTESHSEVVPRFNERFLLSLASCKACLVMDDELNILPISSHMKSPASYVTEGCSSVLETEQDLKNLKKQLYDDFPVGPLVGMCTTLDQGRAVSAFLYAVLDKTLQSTIALIAARGRGKSAALGLAISGAIAAGYSNIFVTAPTPENLKSLFEFVCKGLHGLQYKEHLHYVLVRSGNPEFRKAIIQVNIYKQHRQTVQYIQPRDLAKLSQVELLIIDEAAAIPLPVVRSLLGPYLVFLSSTVNGYEGTGRSLSLKLLNYLEKQNTIPAARHSGRLFQKLELKESVRYASGDPIESWLNGLLCLDITSSIPPISRFPHPSECNLYYINRDTLFSFHKESEMFLQRMVALYVASHYKNSPNDLQLMADAPAHHLFVLLGPVDESKNTLPDILCVIQNGYGSAALGLLTRYYEGQLTNVSEIDCQKNSTKIQDKITEAAEKVSLLEETITPKENLPALLVHIRERFPEKIHYIGASFGLTGELFHFWKKHKFSPFYICDNPNNITGEHSCMVIKPLDTDEIEDSGYGPLGFFTPFYQCFKSRFVKCMALYFRELDYKLAMSILDPKINFSTDEPPVYSENKSSMQVKSFLSHDDITLLEDYIENRIGYGKVRHIVLVLAQCYFEERIPVTLSHLQASILLCMGLQLHDITYIAGRMKLERQQV